MAKLKHILGFKVENTKDGLFLEKQKYAKDVLPKYKMTDCKSSSMLRENNLICSHESKDPKDEIMYC